MTRLATAIGTFALLFAFAAPVGGAQPPPSGDWTITGPVVIEGQEVTAHGNVIILSGGSLELRGATLRMEVLPPSEPRIQVQSGGRLFLNGSEKAPSRIIDGGYDVDDGPMPYNTDFHYRIRIEAGGRLDARQCVIHDVGSNQNVDGPPAGEGFRGSFVIAGFGVIERCTIDFGRGTLDVRGGHAFVNDTTLKDHRRGPTSAAARAGNLYLRNVEGEACFYADEGGVVVAESITRATCKDVPLFGSSGGQMFMQNSTGAYGGFGSSHGFVRNSTITLGRNDKDQSDTVFEAYLGWRVFDANGLPVQGVEVTLTRGGVERHSVTDAQGEGRSWVEVRRLLDHKWTYAGRASQMTFKQGADAYETPVDVFEGATILGLRLDDRGFHEEYRLRFYKGQDSPDLGLVLALGAVVFALRMARTRT